MRMFELLHLRFFQCHSNVRVEFDPHLTVLVGKSGVGKSAVLRALRWVCQNRPQGDEFQQHEAPHVAAKLVIDGHEIVRKKKGRESLYKLDQQEFKAFGNTVPAPIVELLNLSQESFARQHDQAFLFSLTPGQVGNELNSIVNLELIDTTLANLSSSLKKARLEVEVTEDRLRQATTKKEELDWINECILEWNGLRSKEFTISQKGSRIAYIASLIQNRNTLNQTLQNVVQAKFDGFTALSSGENVVQLTEQVTNVQNYLSKLNTCILEQQELKQQKKQLQSQLSEVEECPTCGQPILTSTE